MNRPLSARYAPFIVCFAKLLLLVTSTALADVRFEGDWPDADEKVSLDARRLPRSEAVRKVAEAMKWSVVLHSPSSETVDLQVKKQPATKVLALLLTDGDYVARREGSLINIERAPADGPKTWSATGKPKRVATPAQPPFPEKQLPAANAASKSKKTTPEDRVVSGGNVRVEKDEVVHDVLVFGGSTDIRGTTTGNVTVFGGSARIFEAAHVMGDATVVGGSLTVEDNASVDGDVNVMGGTLRRGDKAKIGGEENIGKTAMGRSERHDDEDVESVAGSVGSAIARAALLFVFGAILLALGTRRMNCLQSELTVRPMRSFALGLVGLIVFALLLVAFVLTIIGIPVAVMAALVAIVAAYAGICAVLTVAGGVLLSHKTHNPYVHLGLGCFLFLITTAIPFLGKFVFLIVLLLGIGTLVSTRGAGLLKPRKLAHS